MAQTLDTLKALQTTLIGALREAFAGRHTNGLTRATVRESVMRVRQLAGMIELREDAEAVRRHRARRRPCAGEMFMEKWGGK